MPAIHSPLPRPLVAGPMEARRVPVRGQLHYLSGPWVLSLESGPSSKWWGSQTGRALCILLGLSFPICNTRVKILHVFLLLQDSWVPFCLCHPPTSCQEATGGRDTPPSCHPAHHSARSGPGSPPLVSLSSASTASL